MKVTQRRYNPQAPTRAEMLKKKQAVLEVIYMPLTSQG
jgi:hypothetical protein